MKSVFNIFQPGLFYFNQCIFKFLFKLKFCVLDIIFICLINVLSEMATPQEKAQSASWFIEKNRMFKLSESTEASMEKIHHHVLHFVDGTRTFKNRGSVPQ